MLKSSVREYVRTYGDEVIMRFLFEIKLRYFSFNEVSRKKGVWMNPFYENYGIQKKLKKLRYHTVLPVLISEINFLA